VGGSAVTAIGDSVSPTAGTAEGWAAWVEQADKAARLVSSTTRKNEGIFLFIRLNLTNK
jgi:hypothetical protein